MIRPNRRCIWLHFILPALAPASALAAQVCTVPPVIPPPAPEAKPHLAADTAAIEGKIASATGDVRVVYRKQALEAPTLTYNRSTGLVTAERGLRYVRDGISLTADSARVDINDYTGIFKDAHFLISASGARGNAARIRSLGDKRYLLTAADYTTCPGPDPVWQLTADEIVLDRESGRGEAYGTVLYFFDVPVFYSPYLNFPIDDERHTGFLTPTVGYSSDSGFELAAPYYINLAPDHDLTITPRLLTERGLLLAAQFRYLNPHSTGAVEAEVLPHDDKFGDGRSLVHVEHIGRVTPHVAVGVNYSNVSDDEYFDDLGTTLASTSQTQLEQRIRVTAVAPWIRFALLAQDFQTLADDNTAAFRQDPYARLPAAQLSVLSPTGPLRFGLNAGLTSFRHEQATEGLRYHLQPRVVWRAGTSGWYIDSELSYHYTHYELEGSHRHGRTRDIASLSLDVGLRFQRILDNGWIQTLEPRAKYLYTEYEPQRSLPLFDTGIPDLHYSRLFADNRFTGIDRIGDANQIALGITSRLIDPRTGRVALRLSLGRVFGFRELKVGLPGAGLIGYDERHSDIVGHITYRPTSHWQADATLQYDADPDRFNRAVVRAGYRSGERRITAGYVFFRETRPRPNGPGFESLEQTQLTLSWPLGDSWHVIGRWNYSLEQHQSMDTLVGFEYRVNCCWAVRAAWRRHLDTDQSEYGTAIMFQIELTGLGRFGDAIQSLLDRDIVSMDSDYYGLLFP